MKKVLKWVVIGFIGLVVLGAVVGGGEEEQAETDANEAVEANADVESVEESGEEEVAEEAEAEEATEEEEAPAVAGIGDTLTVGDMEFTIHGLETATNVGGEWGSNSNGTYLILDTTVKNVGNESVTVDSSFFKVKQGETTYDPDSMATMDANSMENSFFLESVNPNMELNGKIVFDVPEDVAGAGDLMLEVQDGLFLAESGTIELK